MSKRIKASSTPTKTNEQKHAEGRTTIIAALIGIIGVISAAVIGYLGTRAQVEQPIKATQTAEARLTQQARVLPSVAVVIQSPSPTSTPASSPTTTAQTPIATPTPQIFGEDVMRIQFNVSSWAFFPRILPESVKPDLNFPANEASAQIKTALDNESLKTWPFMPPIHRPNISTSMWIDIDITGLGSNTEWIKIDNTMQVTVVAEPVLDGGRAVAVTGIGGSGEERVSSEVVYLSSNYDKSSLDVKFPEGDFFTLQPGEIEVFEIPLQCSAPGQYNVTLGITFTYGGKTGQFAYADIPTLICPKDVTLWKWDSAFYDMKKYLWTGSTYESSP